MLQSSHPIPVPHRIEHCPNVWDCPVQPSSIGVPFRPEGMASFSGTAVDRTGHSLHIRPALLAQFDLAFPSGFICSVQPVQNALQRILCVGEHNTDCTPSVPWLTPVCSFGLTTSALSVRTAITHGNRLNCSNRPYSRLPSGGGWVVMAFQYRYGNLVVQSLFALRICPIFRQVYSKLAPRRSQPSKFASPGEAPKKSAPARAA